MFYHKLLQESIIGIKKRYVEVFRIPQEVNMKNAEYRKGTGCPKRDSVEQEWVVGTRSAGSKAEMSWTWCRKGMVSLQKRKRPDRILRDRL